MYSSAAHCFFKPEITGANCPDLPTGKTGMPTPEIKNDILPVITQAGCFFIVSPMQNISF